MVVGGIVRKIITENKLNITLTRSSIFYMRGDVPKVHCVILVRSQWYGKYKKFFNGRDDVLNHVMCDLVKTENDTEKIQIL